MGHEREKNEEAVSFLSLNEWILFQSNASWDNPYNFKFLKDLHKKIIREVLVREISSEEFLNSYLGDKKKVCSSLFEIDFPWGWKDPRNTFTLEIWRDIFPNAKVIHIYRNPVDVAESLRVREMKVRKEFLKRWSSLGCVPRIGPWKIQASLRVENLEEGFKLWRDYIEKALSWEKVLKGRFLSIKYEDLLANPVSVISKIVEFLELNTDSERVKNFSSGIDSSRRYAFKNAKRLVSFYHRIKNDYYVKLLGYDKII